MKKSSLTFILLLSLVVNSLGQTPTPTPQPQPQQDKSAEDDVVRITTNLVQVDVTVTDKKGQPVTDLRPEEFEIFDAISNLKSVHPICTRNYGRVSWGLFYC